MKKIFLSLLLGAVLVLPVVSLATPVQAQDQVSNGLSNIAGSFPNQVAQNRDLATLLRTIINWALYLSAILAVVFIIIGGYSYITAGGNTDAAKKGRVALTNAIIGLVIIIFSYTIIQVIYNFITTSR